MRFGRLPGDNTINAEMGIGPTNRTDPLVVRSVLETEFLPSLGPTLSAHRRTPIRLW